MNGKIILNTKKLKKVIDLHRESESKIVLTQGTWDMMHIGHARYMREAKKHGNLLVVGVDSDKKVKVRKGPDRPIVPQNERIEMITHLKYVDFVVLKELSAPKWQLIKIVKPDVLIATKETYDKIQLRELKKYCGKVIVLSSQATTSTSAKIRRLQISTAKKIDKALKPKLLKVIEDVLSEIKGEKLKK